MPDDGLEELPPELAAAWRAAEAGEDAAPTLEREPAPQAEPGLRPPPPEPVAVPEPRRRSPVVAFLTLPIVVAAVVAAKVSGIAGWRYGPAAVTVALVVVAVAAGVLLTARQASRAAYLVGAVVVALVGSAWSVSTAPWSHGRLDAHLDRLPTSVLIFRSGTRTGHGWCSPTCPRVTRSYDAVGLQPIGAARLAVGAAQNGGLVPRDAGRVALSRALNIAGRGEPVVIDHQRFTTTIRAVADPADPARGSVVTFEVTARRGVRERPSAPCEEGDLVPVDVDVSARGCPRG